MAQANKKCAVIDLGTNTFHMVMFYQNSSLEISEVYRKRHHVFLSAEGIDKIGEASILRAKNAILEFHEAILFHEPDQVEIIGTEALRKASNGHVIQDFISERLQVPVDVISGEREAELIAKGVIWQFPDLLGSSLIMDIGGGSVEFIHLENGTIKWLHSYPVGVGVLYRKFHHSEPIRSSEIESIEQYLSKEANTLVQYLKEMSVSNLIGASGSFELIPAMLEGKYPPTIINTKVEIEDFNSIRDRLIPSNLDERNSMKGLPPVRARLVIVAFVLMNWIMKVNTFDKLLISKYAVKEGLASEYFD